MAKYLLIAVAFLAASVALAVAVNHREEPAAAEPALILHATDGGLVGTASCSARGCHGSLAPTSDPKDRNPVLQDEYSRWLQQDPHTRAYDVLLKPQSRQISKLLYRDENAHEQPRCLACHTTPALAGGEMHRERLFGVGCEACHGNAGSWLVEHTSKKWKQSDKPGMTNVHNPAVLARTCAGCHIGASAEGDGVVRDMNHDLIAAGHPRLTFEFTAYLANLPPHWNTQASKRPPEAELWALGQLASAEQALTLLADRARRAVPWPEFAEYDCYACHHDLKGKGWRQRPGHFNGRVPGSLPWGTWYYGLLPYLDDRLDGDLKGLTAAMQVPLPKTQEVAKQADALAEMLAKSGAKVSGFDQAKLTTLLAGSFQDKRLPLTWDVVEQLFLARQVLGPPWNSVDERLLQARALKDGGPQPIEPEALLRLLKESVDGRR